MKSRIQILAVVVALLASATTFATEPFSAETEGTFCATCERPDMSAIGELRIDSAKIEMEAQLQEMTEYISEIECQDLQDYANEDEIVEEVMHEFKVDDMMGGGPLMGGPPPGDMPPPGDFGDMPLPPSGKGKPSRKGGGKNPVADLQKKIKSAAKKHVKKCEKQMKKRMQAQGGMNGQNQMNSQMNGMNQMGGMNSMMGMSQMNMGGMNMMGMNSMSGMGNYGMSMMNPMMMNYSGMNNYGMSSMGSYGMNSMMSMGNINSMLYNPYMNYSNYNMYNTGASSYPYSMMTGY